MLCAAEYVRMSTEHQRYSTENQANTIRKYAASHQLEIVRTYADEGKSGLSLDGRDALKKLIDDVQSDRADFQAILVYDISRWGRFQDADESAYYEYICKRAGIRVEYCAEQFENDGSPVSKIVKGVKRAMAGEYSRELLTCHRIFPPFRIRVWPQQWRRTMKRKRFSEEQIIRTLREHEAGARTADLARKHGVSEATLYNWKAKFGGMDVSEARRLKWLEDENGKLKRLLADAMLDVPALRGLLAKKW